MPEIKPEKKKRVVTNTFLSLLSWFTPMCLAFIATPILIKDLGTAQYGLYALVISFLGYAFSNGLGRIAVKYISEFNTSDSSDELSEVVSATLIFSFITGILQAILLAIITPFLVAEILLIPPDLQVVAINTFYLVSLSGLIMMVGQVFQFSLQGIHRFDMYAAFVAANGILLNIGNIFLVKFGFGIVSLLAWNLVVVIVVAVFAYVSSRKLLGAVTFTFKIRRELFASVSKYAFSIIAYQALTSVLFIFERTWIVRRFGSDDLTHYVVPMMLAMYMHGILASFSTVLFPYINEFLQDAIKLKRLYQNATKVIFILVALAVTAFIFSGHLFLSLWIGEDFASRSNNVLAIHSVTFGINALGLVAWQFVEALKHPSLNALSSLAWVLIAVILILGVTGNMGIDAIALSRLAGVTVTIPLILFIEKKFLGGILWGFWVTMILRIAAAATAMALVINATTALMQPSFLNLMISLTCGSIGFAIVSILTGLISKEDLKMIKETSFSYLRPQTAR